MAYDSDDVQDYCKNLARYRRKKRWPFLIVVYMPIKVEADPAHLKMDPNLPIVLRASVAT